MNYHFKACIKEKWKLKISVLIISIYLQYRVEQIFNSKYTSNMSKRRHFLSLYIYICMYVCICIYCPINIMHLYLKYVITFFLFLFSV